MLQNIFNKNKSSEIQFLEIDPFWTLNSFYQILSFYVRRSNLDLGPGIVGRDELSEWGENENWGGQKLQN